MITLTTEQNVPLELEAKIDGLAVYLDNDSLIKLAREDTNRRDRFIRAVCDRGSLIFSLANAVELTGPTLSGTIADIRSFLDAFDNRWFPAGMNVFALTRREFEPDAENHPLLLEDFARAFVHRRAYELSPEGSAVLDMTASTFFKLGSVLDWVAESREAHRAAMVELDAALIARIEDTRKRVEVELSAVDRIMPAVPFDERRPATYYLSALLRLLVNEARAYHLKRNDGLDLCHAVIGAAYASATTVDKQWKRRLEAVRPHAPAQAAATYYSAELDRLVADLESLPLRGE